MVGDLRNALSGLDNGMKPEEIDAIIADWLDNPELMATPELKPGDKVRVELESRAGRSEMTVTAATPLRTAYLKGAAE